MKCCYTWFEDTGLTKKWCDKESTAWRINPYDSEIVGFCGNHDRLDLLGDIGRYATYEAAQLELLRRLL